MHRSSSLIGLAATAVLAISACDDESITPPVETGPLEVSVVGAGVDALISAEITVGDARTEMTSEPGRLSASIPGIEPGSIELRFDFLKERADIGEGQVHTRFADATVAVSDFAGEPIVLDFDELGLVHRVSLAIPGATAFFIDDPCVAMTRLDTDFTTVDTDRAIYEGAFERVLSFVFNVDENYDGGDVLANAEGKADFEAACLGGAWDSADTLICVDIGATLGCMHYVFGEPLGA
ncbi:MAG: hypothetical protein ABFS34_15860 [Gemmatimonadota bacterium]